MLGPVTQFARWYDAHLHRRPLFVKSITSGGLNATADATIQAATNGDKPWDYKRTALYGGVYGMVWYGPFMHAVTTTWGRVLPSTSVPSLAFKSAVDVCTSFAVNLCGVIGLQAYCRGEDPIETIKANHWNSWTTGLCYHPFANLVVYSMPVIYRVLTLNTASFFWNCGMIAFFCENRARHTPRPEPARRDLAILGSHTEDRQRPHAPSHRPAGRRNR